MRGRGEGRLLRLWRPAAPGCSRFGPRVRHRADCVHSAPPGAFGRFEGGPTGRRGSASTQGSQVAAQKQAENPTKERRGSASTQGSQVVAGGRPAGPRAGSGYRAGGRGGGGGGARPHADGRRSPFFDRLILPWRQGRPSLPGPAGLPRMRQEGAAAAGAPCFGCGGMDPYRPAAPLRATRHIAFPGDGGTDGARPQHTACPRRAGERRPPRFRRPQRIVRGASCRPRGGARRRRAGGGVTRGELPDRLCGDAVRPRRARRLRRRRVRPHHRGLSRPPTSSTRRPAACTPSSIRRGTRAWTCCPCRTRGTCARPRTFGSGKRGFRAPTWTPMRTGLSRSTCSSRRGTTATPSTSCSWTGGS